VLYFNNQVVTPELAVKLDKTKFADYVRENYPEVAEFKFDGKKTTVTLKDGRFGTTECHEGDEYNKRSGFLFAYDKARTKTFGMKQIVKLVREGEFPPRALISALFSN